MSFDVESITAPGYLIVRKEAERHGAAKTELKQIDQALVSFPKVQERLAFEFLELMTDGLRGDDRPSTIVVLAFVFSRAIQDDQKSEFLDKLGDVIQRIFDLLGNTTIASSTHQDLSIALEFALIAVRSMDEKRYMRIVGHWVGATRLEPQDIRATIIKRVERSELTLTESMRHLRCELADAIAQFGVNHNPEEEN